MLPEQPTARSPPTLRDEMHRLANTEGSSLCNASALLPEHWDALAPSCVNNTGGFQAHVINHPQCSFLLLPKSQKEVHCIHSCLVLDSDPTQAETVGMVGMGVNPLFKTFHAADAVQPLRAHDYREDRRIPTIGQFFAQAPHKSFKSLNGPPDGDSITSLDSWANHFWVPPQTFLELNPGREASVIQLANDIIQMFVGPPNELGTSLADETAPTLAEASPQPATPPVDDTPNIPAAAHTVHSLLVFLWAVANGHGTAIRLHDIREDPSLEQQCHAVRHVKPIPAAPPAAPPEAAPTTPTPARTPTVPNPAPPTASRRRRRSPSTSSQNTHSSSSNTRTNSRRTHRRRRHHRRRQRRRSQSPDLQTALAQNITALSEHFLKTKELEQSRRSMLNNLHDTARHLFRLLSARTWADTQPALNPFVTKLVEDQKISRALNQLASATSTWTYQVSLKQFSQLLSHGYLAQHPCQQPGGFTAFMCGPRPTKPQRNLELERDHMRFTFGDGKVDEQSIKHYLKQDFTIPKTFHELNDQLGATIQLLELLTHPGGIAVAGYTHGLQLINQHRAFLQPQIAEDPTLAASLLWFLDCVFQQFLTHLTSFAIDPASALQRAQAASLHTLQVRDIDHRLDPLRLHILPQLSSLPGLLTSDRPRDRTPRTAQPAAPPASTQKTWWSTNPGPNPKWAIPAGKTYADYFNPRNEQCRPNLSDWPHIPHHRTKDAQPICLRYQIQGHCNPNCPKAHLPPRHLSRDVTNQLTQRLAAIYK